MDGFMKYALLYLTLLPVMAVASVKIVIENTTDWGNAKWDKLVWQ